MKDIFDIGDVIHVNQHKQGVDMGTYGKMNITHVTPSHVRAYDTAQDKELKFNRKSTRGIHDAEGLYIKHNAGPYKNESLELAEDNYKENIILHDVDTGKIHGTFSSRNAAADEGARLRPGYGNAAISTKAEYDKIKFKKANESTASLIDAIVEGNTIVSAQLFNEALRSRIDEKVAAKKKEVAAKIDNSKTFHTAAKHKSHHIRMQVAKHPNAPHDVLNTLVNDKDVRVAHAALANPKTGTVEVEEKDKKSPLKGLIKHISKYKEEDAK